MTNEFISRLPSNLSGLSELAYNLWFSWNEDALALFRSIDSDKWEAVSHNPVRLLMETEPDLLTKLALDSSFLEHYQHVMDQWESYQEASSWFAEQYPDYMDKTIAYFSAEFGLHESLPIYSGGLGILAGDHCKSASDLGLPLAGVGLMYKKGYFNQKFDANGNQIAEEVLYDFNKLPIRPALGADGELNVEVELPGRRVLLKVWTVAVGTINIYLLDADIDGNSPEDRALTAQLYGGNQDTRIQQEMLLGIGGITALRALGLYPHVYHINEGHAAFLSLERLREHIYSGLPFASALEMVRASTVFTTHTPVPAGHDVFPVAMFEHYMQPLLNALQQNRNEILALGLDSGKQGFNMTYLALNTAALRNGVSRLHGSVSREMFRSFHGGLDTHEVPISYVTNGVHLQTWAAAPMKELYDRFLPGTWRRNATNKDQWASISLVPGESLWKVHDALKERLIEYARKNISEQRRRNSESPERIAEAGTFLNPKALTIGFARRFATYKRATLIFNDHDRLDRLVNDPEKPVQFIFAGKAHPADIPGQDLIREIYRVSQMDRFKGKVVLLENYDMNMAYHLVQGVDVWLNNPRRPYEASGTSGQKAAMNGIINCSILDGWWEEGYDGENGWAIESDVNADFETQERENTDSLYSILEQKIVPLYYAREAGSEVPEAWTEKMKHSIQTLAPIYNTDRMVQEYTTFLYAPTISRAQAFSQNNYETAAQVADYKRFIRDNWQAVSFIGIVDPEVNISFEESIAGQMTKPVKAEVQLGPIWEKDVIVEGIYWADYGGRWDPVIVPFEQVEQTGPQTYVFSGDMPAHLRHGPHYKIRIRPISPDFIHPFEMIQVTYA